MFMFKQITILTISIDKASLTRLFVVLQTYVSRWLKQINVFETYVLFGNGMFMNHFCVSVSWFVICFVICPLSDIASHKQLVYLLYWKFCMCFDIFKCTCLMFVFVLQYLLFYVSCVCCEHLMYILIYLVRTLSMF